MTDKINEVIHMEWFLINIVSPLLLPVFLIVVLGFICDTKPDAFIKIYLDIVQKLFELAFKLCLQGLKLLGEFLKNASRCLCRVIECLAQGCAPDCACGKTPAPRAPRKKKAPPDANDIVHRIQTRRRYYHRHEGED